ncbi:MAG: hypothetical protein M3137_20805 [Actinomycetota bacterium]|nr:hypothetical protein [Actinomycetota bacterium]
MPRRHNIGDRLSDDELVLRNLSGEAIAVLNKDAQVTSHRQDRPVPSPHP